MRVGLPLAAAAGVAAAVSLVAGAGVTAVSVLASWVAVAQPDSATIEATTSAPRPSTLSLPQLACKNRKDRTPLCLTSADVALAGGGLRACRKTTARPRIETPRRPFESWQHAGQNLCGAGGDGGNGLRGVGKARLAEA